jgi:hypothetical protein
MGTDHRSGRERAPGATLLASVAEWHRRLAAQRQHLDVERARTTPTAWKPSGIEPFRFEQVGGGIRRVYTITELLSSRELDEEGRTMGHCVGSYAGSCASGRVSIWSVRIAEPPEQATRLLTLEVSNPDRQLVQARQKGNKLPGPKELMILKRWTSAGGPTLSKWLAR